MEKSFLSFTQQQADGAEAILCIGKGTNAEGVPRQNYSRNVSEYISLEFASRVPADYAQFYIPHHAVTRSEKLRVVFNASAEYQGVSLNKS